ncbi:peptide-methionine (S)-S-oxide reductase MsrA [Antarcticibacterium sp. 1MA-6-2]|uniref:peptide-methionine (S)-S-oxide reductase MsrA n=1 Tax=Antarcticibacterium sp. 1MA-6-2 TaxID=2908210 RepID=UPI001F2B573B|nr:peptide-methionine (S)-S-oxide reductase MsrA [Antarcticibacterium sp. 1MA-6-2]UJH91103.1 peptide-methionine (S)-S-oxide reductase MsrA [Antarcticibacterium sp. 1MA-6-2]
MRNLFLLTIALSLFSCGNGNTQTVTKKEIANAELVEVPMEGNLARAYFASGCFWCVEAIYESMQGVEEVISGYSGGHTKNPTYEESNKGTTGHAEAVEVIYDPEVVDFATLVEVFFGSQNPTQQNGQGPDVGSQYRSIVFFQNQEQKEVIERIKAEVAENYDKPIAAEVLPFQKFWVAEDYHQNYEKLNPDNPYIQNVSIPRLNRFKKKFPELLKANAKAAHK